LIKVDAVGIYASDLKCYHGAAMFWSDENRPAHAQAGVVPRHEFVGVVMADDNEGLRQHGVEVGKQIAPRADRALRPVPLLRPGSVLDVRRARHVRASEFQRRHAEYMLAPTPARVHRIADDLLAHQAAFAAPLSCALHAVERASIAFDDTVVVAGSARSASG
jgi:threonine dehydrogenase-like Zn-dependent dehydrogenase